VDAIETVSLTKHYGRRPPPVRLPFVAPTGIVRALEARRSPYERSLREQEPA